MFKIMNTKTFSNTSGKNCKRPINRIHHSIPDYLDTQIISDDSETEQNINISKSIHHKINMKPNTLNDIIQLTKSIGFQNKSSDKTQYNLNKRLKSFKDIQPSQNFLEVIDLDSKSSETNEPEILIVPPPVPLDSILFKTSSEKTSDFATSTPSSMKKLKAGPLPSPPPSPPSRPMLKNPGGNFEKYLANLEKRFTKLSSEDKVLNWNFSNEVDDVEDFVEFEKHGQMLKMRFRNNNNNNSKNNKNNNINNYNIQGLLQPNQFLENFNLKAQILQEETVNTSEKKPNKIFKKQKIRKYNNNKKLKQISNGRLSTEEVNSTNSDTFKIPNVPRKYLMCKPCQNTEEGCGNSDCEFLTEDHKEEFCKYLGLSTKSQNGEILSSLNDNSDLKRRSLRVRQLQCQSRLTPPYSNLKHETDQILGEHKNIRVYAVRPEKIKNPNVASNQNYNGVNGNMEIRILNSMNSDLIKLNPAQSRQNLYSTPLKNLPEKTNDKAKIKIVCSLNSNTVANHPTLYVNTSNSISHTNLANDIRNSISPLSITSKTNSQKASIGQSSCHADDENSSQNNLESIDRKKDTLIIVKNTYEQKPSLETNNVRKKESNTYFVDDIAEKINQDEKDKSKIKILDRVTYSPKQLKKENILLKRDRLKPLINTNLNSRLSPDENKEVKEKIKIEFSVNYDKNLKNELNSEQLNDFIESKKLEDIKKESSINDDRKCNNIHDKINHDNSIRKNTFKRPKLLMKNINNKQIVISPVPKTIAKYKSLRPNQKFKTLVKNPSSLKFFRLVLKNPKQKFSKKINERKISLKRNRRQKSNSVKSLNLLNKAKTVQKPEEFTKNLNLQQLPKSIVTISSNEVVSENLKLNLIPNPLKFEDGDVLHAYYEKEFLIVVQQNRISFWKYSKILQMLGQEQEWQLLGESKRNLNDEEILSPFKNRLLLHENTPIYIELRARQLPYSSRECNLLSPYICIYYFDLVKDLVQQQAVQLDSIKTLSSNVIYTTITNTRYFVICWKQDTPISTNRTGICKYALTPDLDTLASIREFKHLRHKICSLECINGERLIGFGETQITIWDYHTGDILSNLDLDMQIGRNLSAMLYSLESDHFILLYQLIHCEDDNIDGEEILPQLKIFALNLSHNSPSYRLIYNHKLPIQFENIKSALNLSNYIIVTSISGEELWMFIQQPQRLLFMNDEISTSLKRFYTTGSEHYVEITGDFLNVKTIHENLMNFIST